jgi:hypothetical protein
MGVPAAAAMSPGSPGPEDDDVPPEDEPPLEEEPLADDAVVLDDRLEPVDERALVAPLVDVIADDAPVPPGVLEAVMDPGRVELRGALVLELVTSSLVPVGPDVGAPQAPARTASVVPATLLHAASGHDRIPPRLRISWSPGFRARWHPQPSSDRGSCGRRSG